MSANATDPRALVIASGVIAVVRLKSEMPVAAASALVLGGVALLEITLTTPGAIATIARIASDVPGAVVGAGTILDVKTAGDAMDAGAQFIVSPVLNVAVIAACRERNVPCMPGAFTPTEMLQAWNAGADFVKVFPSAQTGPGFFRDVLAPMPFLRLVPSGGVSVENAGDWIRAGAAAVSVGTSLINGETVQPPNHAALTARARALVQAVAAARNTSAV